MQKHWLSLPELKVINKSMPLNKSKSQKAFSENVKKEMKAGKPQKQAVAIAYAVQRTAKKNKPKGK